METRHHAVAMSERKWLFQDFGINIRVVDPGQPTALPPGTPHVLIGAGGGPATILMVGARGGEMQIHYPVSEVAARHGVSVDTETSDFEDAWRQRGLTPEFDRAPLPWPPS
jgi:uncharacterized cupin superfamily protein